MAFYRALTIAGILALVVLFLDISLPFIARRRNHMRNVYILPKSKQPMCTFYTHSSRVIKFSQPETSIALTPSACLLLHLVE